MAKSRRGGGRGRARFQGFKISRTNNKKKKKGKWGSNPLSGYGDFYADNGGGSDVSMEDFSSDVCAAADAIVASGTCSFEDAFTCSDTSKAKLEENNGEAEGGVQGETLQEPRASNEETLFEEALTCRLESKYGLFWIKEDGKRKQINAGWRPRRGDEFAPLLGKDVHEFTSLIVEWCVIKRSIRRAQNRILASDKKNPMTPLVQHLEKVHGILEKLQSIGARHGANLEIQGRQCQMKEKRMKRMGLNQQRSAAQVSVCSKSISTPMVISTIHPARNTTSEKGGETKKEEPKIPKMLDSSSQYSLEILLYYTMELTVQNGDEKCSVKQAVDQLSSQEDRVVAEAFCKELLHVLEPKISQLTALVKENVIEYIGSRDEREQLRDLWVNREKLLGKLAKVVQKENKEHKHVMVQCRKLTPMEYTSCFRVKNLNQLPEKFHFAIHPPAPFMRRNDLQRDQLFFRTSLGVTGEPDCCELSVKSFWQNAKWGYSCTIKVPEMVTPVSKESQALSSTSAELEGILLGLEVFEERMKAGNTAFPLIISCNKASVMDEIKWAWCLNKVGMVESCCRSSLAMEVAVKLKSLIDSSFGMLKVLLGSSGSSSEPITVKDIKVGVEENKFWMIRRKHSADYVAKVGDIKQMIKPGSLQKYENELDEAFKLYAEGAEKFKLLMNEVEDFRAHSAWKLSKYYETLAIRLKESLLKSTKLAEDVVSLVKKCGFYELEVVEMRKVFLTGV